MDDDIQDGDDPVEAFDRLRAVPEGWHWPEHMAARTLDRPMWDAGQRMMNIAAPESWRAIVADDKIVSGNRDTIDGCSEAAVKAREPR